MTQNEIDITAILNWLIPATTKAPPESITAAMQRLVGQLPKASDVDTRPDGARRKAFLEANKGPRGGNGMVAPLPPTPPADSVTRKQFLENQKRPQYRPPPTTGA